MSEVFGLDAKLYYKVGGQGGGGSWNELDNAKDVTLNVEKEEADLTTRKAQGWRQIVGKLKNGSIEWDMVWDTADAGFQAIKNAFFNDEPIGLQVLDGPLASGGQGLQADFEIMQFSRNEPLAEALTVSVTAKPRYSDTPPQWVGGT